MKSAIFFIFFIFYFTIAQAQLSQWGDGGRLVKKRWFNHFEIAHGMQLGMFYNNISIDTEVVVDKDTVFRCTAMSATVPSNKCIKNSLGYCPLVNHTVYVCQPYKKHSLKIIGKIHTDSLGKIDLIASKRYRNYYVVIDPNGAIAHHFIFDSTDFFGQFPNFQTRRQHKRWLQAQR